MSLYEDKLDALKNLIRLGMDFETACLAAGFTEAEQEEMNEDDYVQFEVLKTQAISEADLLLRHDTSTKIAEMKGGGQSAIQWRLEHLNPKKYSNKEGNGDSFAGKVVVNVIRGKAEETEK